MFEISFPLFYLPTPHLDDLSTRGLRFFILFFSCLHDNDVYIPSHLYLRYDREWASTKAYLEKGGGVRFYFTCFVLGLGRGCYRNPSCICFALGVFLGIFLRMFMFHHIPIFRRCSFLLHLGNSAFLNGFL